MGAVCGLRGDTLCCVAVPVLRRWTCIFLHAGLPSFLCDLRGPLRYEEIARHGERSLLWKALHQLTVIPRADCATCTSTVTLRNSNSVENVPKVPPIHVSTSPSPLLPSPKAKVRPAALKDGCNRRRPPMQSERRRLYAEALRAPPLTPKNAPLRTFDGGNGRHFRLRVPTDEAAVHDLIRQAHKCCSASAASYETEMRREVAKLIASQPVYWSKVWPAGLALSRFVLTKPAMCAGKSVLELGAGLGVGAVCAALAGAARVVVTDIERKGLDFAVQSARDNGITSASAFHAMTWDWNAPPPRDLNGPFDVVLAGDVIYQDEHAPRLGQILWALLRPAGVVIFSDSLERPYKDGHSSLLRKLLASDGFVEVACNDIDVCADAADGMKGGVAAGSRVRVLVCAKPASRR